MLNSGFSPWPSFTDEEAAAVSRVLLSNRVNYWTGDEGRKFEKEFAHWAGSRYGVALANGTLALDVALKALNVGPGDEVVVTPRSFLASVSCVVLAGARPVFADVDLESGNVTAESVEQVLSPRTKALICVHLGGWPCAMGPIMDLAGSHRFAVIEDCAQAHGARYKGRSVGSFGQVGAWSFCQDKIMTTGGEGGMVTTDDEQLWSTMWSYKDHGKSYDAVYNRAHLPGFRWVHESFGTNWRMLELQAVIGRIQLRRMNDWHLQRQINADRLAAGFAAVPALRVPKPEADEEHAWYKFYAFVRPEMLRPDWTRERILCAINDAGVPCVAGSCSEVYLEKAFDGTDYRPPVRLPNARQLGETSLMFMVHPTLGARELDLTVDTVTDVVKRATR